MRIPQSYIPWAYAIHSDTGLLVIRYSATDFTIPVDGGHIDMTGTVIGAGPLVKWQTLLTQDNADQWDGHTAEISQHLLLEIAQGLSEGRQWPWLGFLRACPN